MESIEMSDYGKVIGEGTVRFERLLPGPIERVWEYLTDSDKRALWLAAGEMRPEEGGPFTLVFRHSELSSKAAPIPDKYKGMEGGASVRGTVTRWEPPHSLVFTWDEATGRDSEVTIELQAEGESVRLELTHRRLSTRAVMVDVASGWHTHLGVLVARLENREPEPFWPAHLEAEEAYGGMIP